MLIFFLFSELNSFVGSEPLVVFNYFTYKNLPPLEHTILLGISFASARHDPETIIPWQFGNVSSPLQGQIGAKLYLGGLGMSINSTNPRELYFLGSLQRGRKKSRIFVCRQTLYFLPTCSGRARPLCKQLIASSGRAQP